MSNEVGRLRVTIVKMMDNKQGEFMSSMDALEAIYRAYPRKEGKAKGMAKLKSFRSDELVNVALAVERYKAKLKSENTPPQYTLLFSTFVNGRWQDYVDYEVDNNLSEYSALLKEIGLHLQFSRSLASIGEVWKTPEQFKAYLIDRKDWFSKHHSIDSNFEHFRSFVASDLSKKLGL